MFQMLKIFQVSEMQIPCFRDDLLHNNITLLLTMRRI